MAKKPPAKSRREKKDMTDKIRKRILSAQQSLVDQPKEVEESKAVATAVSSVAVSIEALSDGMEKMFKDMIEELSKIPETVKEKETQSEKILEKLITVILDLEDQLKEETDPEKKEKLQGQIGVLKGEAGKAYDKTADANVPRTMGQVASKFLGVDPKELKDAGGGVGGFLKAFVGTGPDKGVRGDIPKFFGLGSKPSLEDKMTAARGSREIAGTLDKAKEEKENERKAAIAARLKDTPEHLRVKSDDQGRFRTGTKGARIDEYRTNAAGERALNPQFQPASGMFGKQLQDEGTGYTYEAGKGVQSGMVPGGAGESVPAAGMGALDLTSHLPAGRSISKTDPKSGQTDIILPGDRRYADALASGEYKESADSGGTDPETDTFKEDVLKKLDGFDENFEDLEDATIKSGGGLLGGLMKFLGPIAPALGAIGPALLPIGVAIAGVWAAMKVFQAFKEFGEMREAQKGLKEAEERGKTMEANLENTLQERDPDLLKRAKELQEADPKAGEKNLAVYVRQARRERGDVPTSATSTSATPAATTSAAVTSTASSATATASMAPTPSTTTTAPTPTPARATVPAALATTAPASAPAPVINNIDNSQRVNAPQAAAAPASGASSVSLRDTHNSYMRFQERRMSRIM
jgi:hypothetical protein